MATPDPPALPDLPDPAVFERQADLLSGLAVDLHRDRSERRRSDWIARVATLVAVLLFIVDTTALVVILRVQSDNRRSIRTIQEVQADNTRRQALTEQIVRDGGRTLALLDCTFTSIGLRSTQDPVELERRRLAVVACLRERGIEFDTPPPG